MSKKNLQYEQAKQDYVNCCEMLEKQEFTVDRAREELRIELILHGTLAQAKEMFALRMRELSTQISTSTPVERKS